MRMSCNGCRVLRKGCSESCTIRPCLQWIKNPESQAHATLFLAKFYGRAGLLNLLAAGSDNVRPAIFRSLLYEACGRMVNPVYGSVGLLWTGSWQLCHAAVEAVLSGKQITQVVPAADSAAANPLPPLKSYDIRHVSKDSDLHKVSRARTKFKRTAKPRRGDLSRREPSQEAACQVDVEVEVEGSEFSMETEEASHVSQGEPMVSRSEEEEVELDLSLGLEPMGLSGSSGCRVAMLEREEMNGQDGATCQLGL